MFINSGRRKFLKNFYLLSYGFVLNIFCQFLCAVIHFFFYSVPIDEEERVVLDYSSDPLINDGNFQQSILSSIARAGNAIEELYGSPQDIEGVIRDGKVYVVQTRPQM